MTMMMMMIIMILMLIIIIIIILLCQLSSRFGTVLAFKLIVCY